MFDITLTILLLNSAAIAQSQSDPQTMDAPLPVWALEFSPDGHYLAAATGLTNSRGGGLVVWRTSDWKPHIVRFEAKSCSDVSFSPDGKTLAFRTAATDVGLYDVESGELTKRFTADATRLQSVEFTADGKTLVTAGADRNIKLWDVQTLQLKSELKGHTDIIYDACISPDGSLVLSASRDKTARLWYLRTGEPIEIHRTSTYIARRAGFSTDGRFFFSAWYEGYVRIYDTGNFQLRAKIRGSDCACLSRDNQWVATSGRNDTAHVYRLHLNEPTDEQQKRINTLIQTFHNDDYDVREAASEDIVQLGLIAEPSLRKAMQSDSAEVRLRAGRARRKILSPEPEVELGGHAGDVEVVCFSPDDRLLVTGCRGGSTRVWDAKTWKLVKELPNPLYQPAEE